MQGVLGAKPSKSCTSRRKTPEYFLGLPGVREANNLQKEAGVGLVSLILDVPNRFLPVFFQNPQREENSSPGDDTRKQDTTDEKISTDAKTPNKLGVKETKTMVSSSITRYQVSCARLQSLRRYSRKDRYLPRSEPCSPGNSERMKDKESSKSLPCSPRGSHVTPAPENAEPKGTADCKDEVKKDDGEKKATKPTAGST